jgi:hypothetical protein
MLAVVITFRVVKTDAGWGIQSHSPMSTVYLSLRAAIEHANELADALRRHGQAATVLIDESAGQRP